jgi:pimeloyl-ACP methyl ester carboxylesterase
MAFLASSHQYRDLISVLADHFHVVAPDCPGFGNSDLPSPDEFNYTFDRLSVVIVDFLNTGYVENIINITRLISLCMFVGYAY